ncbi:MAG TPA: hypothetical protein PKA90_13260 [Ignavibacteria bacterium]|nr:hypothetical protein [Ignavibacteria bacterium]HMR41387.1 hypothetical protein [Ignavibacteria bacterium]
MQQPKSLGCGFPSISAGIKPAATLIIVLSDKHRGLGRRKNMYIYKRSHPLLEWLRA